jgi:hypothetical protein
MRVIIIEDKDCKALIDALELKKVSVIKQCEGQGASTDQVVHDLFRGLRFEVISWLQQQGWR